MEKNRFRIEASSSGASRLISCPEPFTMCRFAPGISVASSSDALRLARSFSPQIITIMNVMYETSVKEAKQLPDFSGTDDSLVKLTLNGLVLDKKMLTMINKIGNERLESLTTSDFLAINAIYYEQKMNSILRARMKHLTELGIVEHIGRNKYVLARSLYDAAGKSGVHTRIVGLDRETNKELLLKHIRE